MPMNWKVKIFITYGLVLIGLIVLGARWRSWDDAEIRDMDYQKLSFLRQRHTPDNKMDLQRYTDQVKEILRNENLYITDDYKVGNSVREIIGQSSKNWLWANYINKITIVSVLTKQEGESGKLHREFLVYNGFIHAGSKAYIGIVLFCIMVVAVFSAGKEHLPNIIPEPSIETKKRETK